MVLVAAIFALGSSAHPARAVSTRQDVRRLVDGVSVGVIRFDDVEKDFYWGAHRMRSPVVFTVRGTQLLANGFDEELTAEMTAGAPSMDTTGSARTLMTAFGRVPFVDSLVRPIA